LEYHMNSVTIKLPEWTGAKEVFNHLVEDDSFYSSDLVYITLGNGYHLDVGWYPENDPNGKYIVVLYVSDFDNPIQELEFTKVQEVVACLEDMATKHVQHVTKLSGESTKSLQSLRNMQEQYVKRYK